MTLTEAYESLLKVNARRESITDPDESLMADDGKDCGMISESSEDPVFQEFLSKRLNICMV